MLDESLLYPMQQEASTLFAQERGGIAWHRVGEGKTRIAIAAFLKYIPEGDVTSQLLVFARPEAFFDWRQEADKMDLPSEQLLLRSYAMLSQLSAEQTVVDIQKNPAIAMVCFDELYLYKNPASNRTRAANAISSIKPAIGLSGSIMTAMRIEDVYGQAFAINKHRRIAPTLTTFRETYMNGINQFGGLRWFPKRGAYAKLMEACTDFAHVHMPKTSDRLIRESIVQVDVTSQQAELFRELQETMTIMDIDLELTNAANLITKVQQISNGWVQDGEEEYHPIPSDKITKCLALLDEIIETGKKVIVWCAFRFDVDLLAAHWHATHSNIPYVTMMGGKPFDIDTWQQPKTMVCFATEASGSSVNHFSQVEYAIYFSMSHRWIDYQQSRGRTDRKNSTHETCYYYYLHTRLSMDERILRRVRQAGSAEGAMLKLAADMQAWLSRSLKKESRDEPIE